MIRLFIKTYHNDYQVGEGYQAVIPLSGSSCSLEWLLDCTYGGALPQVIHIIIIIIIIIIFINQHRQHCDLHHYHCRHSIIFTLEWLLDCTYGGALPQVIHIIIIIVIIIITIISGGSSGSAAGHNCQLST